MLKYLIFFSIFLVLSSCTPKYLSKNIPKDITKICLNLDGNGRLTVQGHKYVFSAETVLDEEEDKWIMGMGFPLHGQETVELELDQEKAVFNEKIQEKVLSEKAGINPQDLQLFMEKWAAFLNEVIAIKRTGREPSDQFDWSVSKKMLIAESKIDQERQIIANFYNLTNNSGAASGSHFSRMDFLLKPSDEAKQIKIELIVRKCLDT